MSQCVTGKWMVTSNGQNSDRHPNDDFTSLVKWKIILFGKRFSNHTSDALHENI